MARMFRFKNLAVSLLPEAVEAVTDKLKLCVFHSTICLGWTHCKFHSRCHHWFSIDCYGLSHGCLKWVSICQQGTCHHFSPPCPFNSIECPAGTVICPGGSVGCPGGSIFEQFDPHQIDPVAYVQQVAELKADLRAALAEVEAHEKTLGDVTRPGTLSEAETLESELKSALKEVDAMKAQLRRKKSE